MTLNGGAGGVMVIVVGNGHGEYGEILDEGLWILYSTNMLINPTILSSAMDIL